jgi:hypothetical protein
METKTIGTAVAGVIIGGAMMAGLTVDAAEKITVENAPTKDKRELTISVEAPTVTTYTIAQIESEVVAYDQRISQLNRDLAELTAKRNEKKALLDKLQAAVK